MIADSLITDTLIANPLHWETVKLIINSQHNLAVRQQWLSIIGISVLLGLVAIALGLNWWSAKRDVKNIKNDFKTMEAEIEKDVDEKLGNIDTKIQLMDKKMAWFDAEKSRLLAVVAWNAKAFDSAARWSAEAIKGYTNPKVNDKDRTRSSVNKLIGSIEECFKENKGMTHCKKAIERALPHIPETLNKEKKKIESLLEGIYKKMAKSDADDKKSSAELSEHRKDFSAATGEWARTIIRYANPKVDNKNMIKISVDGLIRNLKKCINKKKSFKDRHRKVIEVALPHIPETLDEEKKEIEDLLEKLPKE